MTLSHPIAAIDQTPHLQLAQNQAVVDIEAGKTKVPLRILIVQETNWIDRNVIQQHHLAERLVKRGHQVEVIDFDILWQRRPDNTRWQPRQVFPAVNKVLDGVSLRVTRPATIQVPLLDSATWTISSLAELRQRVKQHEVDVVIGLTLSNSYLMALLLHRWRIPNVSVVLEPYHTMVPQRWLWPPARTVERHALRRADRVVVFTPQMHQYAISMGVEPDRTVLLKTGVSLDMFHPQVDGAVRRQELGIAADEWVLFFMGWLYDFSGLREITRTIGADPAVLNGARLLIVGNGDIYHELQAMVETYGIDHHVLVIGQRPYDQIPSLVAAADVCMAPSLLNDTTREIVPMKVYEYLAAGKPVVASNLPGLNVEFGDNGGLLYADGPVAALKTAVALANDRAKAREVAEAGRMTALRNADWDRTTEELEAMLARVITCYQVDDSSRNGLESVSPL